jgi:hypothetical protein
MQVIAPARREPTPRATLRVLSGLIVGLVLVGGGVLIGYLAFGTSLLDRFAAPARPSAGQTAAGAVAWTVALIGPALFVVVGLIRLGAMLEEIGARRPRPPKTARFSDLLTDEYVVATRVRLLDGRTIPELVIGPFGAAVVSELPPSSVARSRGGLWEIRLHDGRWAPMESPLDRTTRDAEAVRRWLGHEDRDHVVKVYAAVIAPDNSPMRTPSCAVVAHDQLAAWLAGLPAQRGLTPDRRARLVELVRAAV